MVLRIDAPATVHVCAAITVSAVPFQRATVMVAWPEIDPVSCDHVVASSSSCELGAFVAVANSCSSNVGLTTWT